MLSCRRQIWEEMRAAAERNRQQITGQPPRSRPPSRPSSRPPSPPRSQPASCPASRPQSPPHSRPPSRPASRPTSRPHSPPSLDPIQAVHKPSAAPPRQGLPPRAQPGPALASGRALVHDQPTAVSAANAVARAAAVQVPAQQGQHAKQPDADQGHAPALPSALQQASPQPVRTPVSAPQIGAVSQQPMRQQPLQQPASPGGQEMLHQVEFVIPGAAHRGGLIPSQRVAELQTAGQENGSGGSLEGVSELQPIPRLSPRDGAAADEEAEYGQMVEEMQQVVLHCLHDCLRKLNSLRKEKKRKNYALWRQFIDKPIIVLGCPGLNFLTHCKLGCSQHQSMLWPRSDHHAWSV